MRIRGRARDGWKTKGKCWKPHFRYFQSPFLQSACETSIYTPGGVSLYALGRLMCLPPLSPCQDPGECSAPDHQRPANMGGCRSVPKYSNTTVFLY